jgi:uncharacterized protein Yka (UPF0111/DUF47 family)
MQGDMEVSQGVVSLALSGLVGLVSGAFSAGIWTGGTKARIQRLEEQASRLEKKIDDHQAQIMRELLELQRSIALITRP